MPRRTAARGASPDTESPLTYSGEAATLEARARATGQALILGVDEVGRGPLAGPVVACAVLLGPECVALPGVTDSKALSAAQRARVLPLIRGAARAIGIGAASVREIDALNIHRATALAMRRAIARVVPPWDLLLVDGTPFPALGLAHTAVVQGDAHCLSIACASVVAKETRDRLMRALAARHPAYGWARNAGYGTAEHLSALRDCGPTSHHRRSFRPLRDQLALFEAD